MKCSNCGSNNLKEVEFPVMVLYDSGEVNKDTVTYICLDCGHYEFFNVKVTQTLKKQKDDQDKIENQVDNLLKEIDKLDDEYKKSIYDSLTFRYDDIVANKTSTLITSTIRVSPKPLKNTLYDLNTNCNFINSHPILFLFEGKQYAVQHWNDMLLKIVTILYDKDETKIVKLVPNSTGVSEFKNKIFYGKKGFKPKQIKNTGIFIETDYNANSILDCIRMFIKYYGISFNQYSFMVTY